MTCGGMGEVEQLRRPQQQRDPGRLYRSFMRVISNSLGVSGTASG